MAAVNTGIPLSHSNNLPINIATTNSPGTLIHTTDTQDHYISVWVSNISTNPVTITVLKGSGSTYLVDSVTNVPPQSIKIPVEPGILLTGENEYRMYASQPNVIKVSGHVMKRTGEL